MKLKKSIFIVLTTVLFLSCKPSKEACQSLFPVEVPKHKIEVIKKNSWRCEVTVDNSIFSVEALFEKGDWRRGALFVNGKEVSLDAFIVKFKWASGKKKIKDLLQ